tara:strand:+ start:124 stop:759 length:636 start_codon:yes stop_codon:yes gene_type:complete
MLNLLKGFSVPKTVQRESFTVVNDYFNALDTIRGNEDHFIYEGNLINSLLKVKGKRKEKRMTELNLYAYSQEERHFLAKIAKNAKAFKAYVADFPMDKRLPSFETIYKNSVKGYDENGIKKPSQPIMSGEKNLPKAENQLRNSKPKIEAEKPIVEKAETLEQAVQEYLSILFEFDTNEAEVANLIFKALKKRNPKLKTTSNKESVALKIAN